MPQILCGKRCISKFMNFAEEYLMKKKWELLLTMLPHIERFCGKTRFRVPFPDRNRPDPFELENVVITSVMLFTRHFISCYCLLSGHRGSSQTAGICRDSLISTFLKFVDKLWSNQVKETICINRICNHIRCATCIIIYTRILLIYIIDLNVFVLQIMQLYVHATKENSK